ncbi:MAG: glycosyltransferase family 4 protein [Candidatus Woykebacteria bacterium]
MKVCMVLNNPFTNDSRVLREAQTLVDKGFKITIYATKKSGLPSSEVTKGVTVKRSVDRYDVRLRFWKFFTQIRPVIKTLVEEKADIYHAHDLDTLQIAYYAAKQTNAKLVYDSHELYTERYFKKGLPIYSHLKSSLYKAMLRFIESAIAPKVDWVITVNDSIATELKNRYKLNKVTVVMNCQPKSVVDSRGEGKLRDLLQLRQETKIILYQGYMTSIRGLDKLVESVKYVKGDLVLVLMGEGQVKKELEERVKTGNLKDKVRFLPLVDPKKVLEFISDADLGVIPYQNICLNNYYSTPNKLFDYIASGIAVVASDFPQLRKIVVDNKIGLVFDETNPKDIAAKINEIISDEKKLWEMKENARGIFKTKYNWENEEKKLLAAYKKLAL